VTTKQSVQIPPTCPSENDDKNSSSDFWWIILISIIAFIFIGFFIRIAQIDQSVAQTKGMMTVTTLLFFNNNVGIIHREVITPTILNLLSKTMIDLKLNHSR